jgi:hypothetical protein
MGALRVIRERHQALEAALDRSSGGQPDCNPAILAQTTTVTTYPTSASLYYACNPLSLTGTEGEGLSATSNADTDTVLYAINLGTAIPPASTPVILHSVGGRWAFRYDG